MKTYLKVYQTLNLWFVNKYKNILYLYNITTLPITIEFSDFLVWARCLCSWDAYFDTSIKTKIYIIWSSGTSNGDAFFMTLSPLDRGWEIITRKTIPGPTDFPRHPSGHKNNEQHAFFPSLHLSGRRISELYSIV